VLVLNLRSFVHPSKPVVPTKLNVGMEVA